MPGVNIRFTPGFNLNIHKERRIMTNTQIAKGQRRPIPLLIICFFATVCNGMAVYKFVPIITALMSYWGVLQGKIGILQSANSYLVILLIIPIGFLQRKMKPRISGLLAMIFMVFGNVLGFFAPTFTVLIIARIFEGIGATTINTLTQNLVLNAFTDKNRATATGILNCGQYVGQFANIFVANMFMAQYGWQSVYAFMAICEIIFAIAWILYINRSVTISGLKNPKEVEAAYNNADKPVSKLARLFLAPPEPVIAGEEKKKGGYAKILKNKYFWLLMGSFVLYGPCISSISTYIPAYLESRGMDTISANNVFQFTVIFGCISMAFTGIVSDLLKTKRKIAMISYYGTIVLYFLMMKVPLGVMAVIMIFLGLIPRTLSVLTFSALPLMVEDPRDVPLANSTIVMGNQIVHILGNILLGFLIEKAGYETTFYVVMGLLVVAGTLWALNKRVK